jgi:hypothetical protein
LPFDNEHGARVLSPDVPHDGVASKQLAPGVRAILFIKDGKSEIQSLRFDRTKFTPEEVRKWAADHAFNIVEFEEAKGKAEQSTNAEHDVILQRLDQETEYGKFTPEAFQPTAALWDGIPLIYAQQHPELDAMVEDPIAELERIKGRIVGAVKGGAVDTNGTPRLMGGFDWGDDAEVQGTFDEGKLGHSTAFWFSGKGNDGAMRGPVIPNHVLLFRQDGTIAPKDKGAMILNAEQIKTGEGKGLMDRFKEWLLAMPKLDIGQNGGENVNEKEFEEKLASANAKLSDVQSKLDSEKAEAVKNAEAVKAKDAEIASMRLKIEAHDKAAKDAAWNAVKAKLPVGMTKDEPAARAEFESDPAGFMLKGLEAAQNAVRETKQEGAENASNGEAKRGVDRYNPETKKYEVI